MQVTSNNLTTLKQKKSFFNYNGSTAKENKTKIQSCHVSTKSIGIINIQNIIKFIEKNTMKCSFCFK